MQTLGFTRGANRPDHIVAAPDTFVRAPFPGMKHSVAVVHISPARGARFAQYTLEMNAGGSLAPTELQRFVYALDGTVIAGNARMEAGGYAFIPAGADVPLAAVTQSRLAIVEKFYVPARDFDLPQLITGNERTVAPVAFNDDPSVTVQTLLPAGFEYDCAVNIMSFEPGASLPMVEVHVMEHGLLMLEGGGIYRLSDCWYPVTAGDFIWMAPFCPQWFGCIGKNPAKYLIYKDFNRSPLLP